MLCILESVLKYGDVFVEELLESDIQDPPQDEFKKLEENDKKRKGIASDLTTSQGRRYNDGKKGNLNINKSSLPYDQTRVKLKTPIDGVDYINASWIQKVKEDNLYDDVYQFLPSTKINFILTQDPTPDSQQYFHQIHRMASDLLLLGEYQQL